MATKKWCLLCYRKDDQRGIINENEIDDHYNIYHSQQQDEWKKWTLTQKSFEMKESKLKRNKASSPTSENQEYLENKFDKNLYFFHSKTQSDIIKYRDYGVPYPIAFFGEPYRFAQHDYDWTIHVYWSHSEEDELYRERIRELLDRHPKLAKKLKDDYTEHIHIDPYNDIKGIHNNKIDKMNFKQKALSILREIKQCQNWCSPFLKPVDPQKDRAPDYYDLIKHPMDLQTLKRQIDSCKINCIDDFISKLSLIWCNARIYNSLKTHDVHQKSIKMQTECKRALRKYFPESLNNNSNQNMQITLKQHMHSDDKYLVCPFCDIRLEFMCGLNSNCDCMTLVNDDCVKCFKCKQLLNDTSIFYYHCVNGCMLLESSHHLYLCQFCADEHYNIKQIESFPFRGLWTDISATRDANNNLIPFYEAIIIKQESTNIIHERVFYSEHPKKNIFEQAINATIDVNDNHDALLFRNNNNSDFAVLNGKKLTFYDDDTNNNNSEAIMKFTKLEPVCNQCGSQLLFMNRDVLPNGDSIRIICDIHNEFYNDKNKRNYVSFRAFHYKNTKKIHKIAFYYTCTKCNDFDVCAGCVLMKNEEIFIQNENENQNQNQNQNNNKNEDDKYIIMDIDNSPPQNKKQRMLLLNDDNNNYKINQNRKRNRNEFEFEMKQYYQLYLKEKEKNKQLTKEVNKWKSNFDRLYSKMHNLVSPNNNNTSEIKLTKL